MGLRQKAETVSIKTYQPSQAPTERPHSPFFAAKNNFQALLKNLQIEKGGFLVKTNEDFYGLMSSILSQLKQIRIFSIELFILKHTKEALEHRTDSEIRNVKLSEKIVLIQGIINCILTISILGVAGYYIMEKTLTIGSMIAFNSYMEKLIFTVGRLLQINRNKQGVYVSKYRLESLNFERQENEIHCKGIKQIDSIKFNHVYFSYNTNSQGLITLT